MNITDFLWLDEIVEKLEVKHQVTQEEVEQVFVTKQQNEDVYAAYGQTEAGRYLTVFFIHKPGHLALIISARDMDDKERKRYGKK
jgi:uncharacterized DUF497 family protein